MKKLIKFLKSLFGYGTTEKTEEVKPCICPSTPRQSEETSDVVEKKTISISVPVGDKSKEDAEEILTEMIEEYKEEISFDDDLGTIGVNGTAHIPYNKEIWLPTPEDNGTPVIETITESEKVEETVEVEVPTMKNTKKEIQAYLTANNISYSKKDTKSKLIAKVSK